MSLICPICSSLLIKETNSYKCCNKHLFDLSKEGYLNLLVSKSNCGDNIDLVKARKSFLLKDYYKPLLNTINEIIIKYNIKHLLDCGCGIGYYTKSFNTSCFGIDISKEAIKYASKLDKNHFYVVASNNQIPYLDNTFDCCLHIFSPVFENEAYRVSSKYLIIVNANPMHLIELKKLLYTNLFIKEKQVTMNSFKLLESLDQNFQISLNKEDLLSLISMTPYFYTTKVTLDDLVIENTLVTVDFNIKIYQKI